MYPPTAKDGPTQKAPGYDDRIDRDTEHDPAIDDPSPGAAPMTDPDTEGNMGKSDDDNDPARPDPRPGD